MFQNSPGAVGHSASDICRNSSIPARLAALSCAAAMALLASACTTTGTGIGSSSTPGAATTFTWSAQGPRTGTMTAVLANQHQYSGPFFQVTRETRVEELGPLWTGWDPVGGRGFYRGRRGGWGGWGYWGPSDQFVTEYSGKVLANLSGADGRMRCRFTLIRPSSGMSGGGEGQCQIADGVRIHASFAPH